MVSLLNNSAAVMMKFGCNLSVFKPEKRRHLWLITGLFALVIMVHYLKFPNETIKGTLFSFQWWDSNRRNETYQMANASFSAKKEATDLKNGLALENASNAEPNQQKKTPFHPTSSTVQISIPPEMAMVSPSPLSQSVRDGTNATLVDISPRPKEVIVIKKMTSDRNISCENPMVKKMAMTQKEMGAVPFSEMKNMLFHNQSPYLLIKPLWPSIVDQELLNAKSQIENAEKIQDDDDDGLHAPLYWNVSKFKRSYELMEKTLKVYIYREGERPVFHKPDLRGIYASEGWFMKQLTTNTKYITDDPTKAHLFYLPFGSHNLQRSLYVPDSHSFANLIEYLNAYLQLIRGRYPFWNRTCGADHFLVACHDWAAEETRWHMANCIRSLCNADLREGFQFGKDVSLPETYMHFAQDPLKNLGGNAPSERSFLAFFAGRMHGDLRPTLLKHWENKDPDMKIFGRMNRKDYAKHMKSSRYCICARGYEVNSPRVVEAISYECVPVIVSDNFVAPFLETLNWESFAVFVLEKEILNLKRLLESIPEKRYREMHERVKHVQRHFLWHNPTPHKYDVFHMILHSIWYTRVFRATAAT
ncbi:hypothetical protein DM860_000708 [Cuscuta australis]|uniref:Exostosin GT47 domain-containing protein n=1 Tax=Cuscuta australis TaxID=267555 RepID=A0A328CXP7_9ASTE|nr:hypothetical protein DM860_000708 [Cuscuta australis]